jgi:hypothetical protein
MKLHALMILTAGWLLAVDTPGDGRVKPPPKTRRHYHVFWCVNPQRLKHATHITPQVRVKADTEAARRHPAYPLQEFWLKRGLMPLRHVEGSTAASKRTAKQLADYWCQAATLGYQGIAIDEFLADNGGPVDKKMAEALRLTRQRAPKLFIAVWHSRALSPVLQKAYRAAADLVMIESYHRGAGFEKGFAATVQTVRRAKLAHKTILALGINDKQPKGHPWANSKQAIKAQITWIRKHAPEMPGVAFFAPHASQKLVDYADKLVG